MHFFHFRPDPQGQGSLRPILTAFLTGCFLTVPSPPALPGLEFVGAERHIFTHIEWHMTGWAGTWPGGDLPEGWVWADKQALAGRYPVPNAFAGFMDAVLERLKE